VRFSIEYTTRLPILMIQVLPAPPRPRNIQLTLLDMSVPPPYPPYSLDAPLNRHAAEALADVLSAEWGLSDLRLENGVIEGEDALKPILHALLISGTLPNLGLGGNRKIKAGGWRLVAVFLKKVSSRYLNDNDVGF
jgi:protein phosphatase 1 regulatory subunit 37